MAKDLLESLRTLSIVVFTYLTPFVRIPQRTLPATTTTANSLPQKNLHFRFLNLFPKFSFFFLRAATRLSSRLRRRLVAFFCCLALKKSKIRVKFKCYLKLFVLLSPSPPDFQRRSSSERTSCGWRFFLSLISI